ncbi:AfsR/SARP family transcriptional regulator [Alkaliphilus serpentinus]|uniref:OmpR/PhoB-type domain-containing protein n=1 Tax=Alkaliphilus serpentinus TaxID=1482731 RepID=A0A833M8H5_9FIRM|nr:BTAD domain-containing putative transcriptional regulator [Alkaliphilus serpentinus]KAB3531072.1 hypothetical protein F8153_05400 [Alkaliphilus serpentinus]
MVHTSTSIQKLDEIESSQLIVYTLGRFEVNRGHNKLYQSSSRSRKPWDLFKYMVTNKNKNLSLEKIFDNVFMDENYNNPRNVLKNSVYRLRKLLEAKDSFKYNYIIFSNECYRLDSSNIWIDVDCFEKLIENAELLKDVNPQEAILLYKEAIELYTGDYLNDNSNMDWVIPSRSYYRRLYLQCCLELTQLFDNEKKYDEILKVCDQFMKIEPYEEEIHICFMGALMMKGQNKEALKHYEYCTSIFYKVFGIKPSIKMKRLYESMKKDYNGQHLLAIKASLSSYSKWSGAFFCEPRVFKSIIQLENRKNERSGDEIYLGSIILRIHQFTDSKYILQIIDSVKKIIENDLRKGDAYTQWADNEFLIMFDGLRSQQIDKALRRVVNHIERVLKLEGIRVHIKLLSPEEYRHLV